jgi:acetylornithine deacetylase/succinyl-diaminopimelate desuccinylase-like protein
VDEENISEGAWIAIKEKKDFFEDVDMVISAEPNFGKGLYSVTRGRTGRCIFQVNVNGKTAHIAEFQQGIDAIEKAGHIITKIYNYRDKLIQKTGSIVQVRNMHAESVGMSVCAHLVFEIEVLISPQDTAENIKADLKNLIEERIELKPRKTPYLQGYYFESFPYFTEIGNIIKKFTHKNMKLETRVSVADDNVLATLGIPILTWGPDGGNAHTANEFVNMDSLDILAKMYRSFLAIRKENKV